MNHFHCKCVFYTENHYKNWVITREETTICFVNNIYTCGQMSFFHFRQSYDTKSIQKNNIHQIYTYICQINTIYLVYISCISYFLCLFRIYCVNNYLRFEIKSPRTKCFESNLDLENVRMINECTQMVTGMHLNRTFSADNIWLCGKTNVEIFVVETVGLSKNQT